MRRRSRPHDEDGFILLESMVAISLITVILAALGTFTLNSVALTSQLRARQGAVQIATSAMASLGAVPATDLVTGRDATSVTAQFAAAPGSVTPSLAAMSKVSDPVATAGAGATATVSTSPVPQVLNNISFTVNTYLGRCFMQAATTDCRPTGAGVEQLRAVVAVTWQGKGCGSASCAYVSTTIVNQDDDPIFNLNTANPPVVPAVQPPGNQVSTLGGMVSLQLTVKPNTGVPPLTWQVTTGTLPAGLTLTASGLVSGAPTVTAPSTPLTVTVSDAFGRTGTGSFTWTVVGPPTVTTPATQTTTKGAAVNLAISSTCPNTPCVFTMANAPTGLSINSANGTITGAPNTVATYASVTVTVTDAASVAASTLPFTWNVVPPATIGTIPVLRATIGATKSVPVTWTCPTANCTLTLAGTMPGLGLSATTPNGTNNATTTLPLTGTSGTTYLAGIVQSSAVTSGASKAYAPTVTITGGGSPVTSGAGDWIAYAKATTAAVVARTVNVGAATNVAFTYSCPNVPCTITLPATVPGLGLSTNPANTATNNVTSLVVATATGTVYVNGTVAGSAVSSGITQGWPVTVSIADADSISTTTSATWTATKAPKIADPGSQAVEPNQNLSLPITTSCANGACRWQAWLQGPYWWDSTWYPLTISSSGVITASNMASGSYVMKVTVTDALGMTDTVTIALTVQSFTLVIPDQATNRPASGTTVVTFDVSPFVQPLAAGYSYTVTGAPAWLSLSNNGTFTATITPTTNLGITTMTVTVTSRASSTSSASDTSFRWTVQ